MIQQRKYTNRIASEVRRNRGRSAIVETYFEPSGRGFDVALTARPKPQLRATLTLRGNLIILRKFSGVFSGTGRILLLRISLLRLEGHADDIGHHPGRLPVQMAVTVGRGLNRLVAEVTLDHRQWDTGLNKPAGVPEVMGSWACLVRPVLFGPDQCGHPDVGVEVLEHAPDPSSSVTNPCRSW